MRFSVALPKDNAILMMLASFLIVIIGISAASNDPASHHIESISIVGALALLVTYTVWIVHYIRGDERGLPSYGEPAISMTISLVLLGDRRRRCRARLRLVRRFPARRRWPGSGSRRPSRVS